MKFVHKPTIVDAFRWYPGVSVRGVTNMGEIAHVDTLGYKIVVKPGDWVVYDWNQIPHVYRNKVFEEMFTHWEDYEE